MSGIRTLFAVLLFAVPAFAQAGGVPSPTDLVCDPTGPSSLLMAWTNPESYDHIDVLVDGIVVDTLPGTATFYEATALTPGLHTLCLEAFNPALETAPLVCCDFDVQMPDPITDLVCDPSGVGLGIVVIGWTNGGVYTDIVVTVDGGIVVTLPGTTTFYEVNGLSAGPHTICVVPYAGTLALAPQCCDVDVDGAYDPPEDLICDVIGADVVLSWVNLGAYSTLEIWVGANLVAVLPASATSYTVTGLAPGLHTICVIARTLGTSLTPVCCEVEIDPVAGEPPMDLVCDASGDPGEVILEWVNMDTYTSIEIYDDGTLFATLPPTAETYTLAGLITGVHTICVQAYKLGSPLDPVCCVVDVAGVVSPASVSELVCGFTTGVAGPVLSWVNHGPYAYIEIFVDGALVDTILGSDTSYAVTGLGPGVHLICVQPTDLSGIVLPEVCCDIVVGAADGPSGLICDPSWSDLTVVLTWANGGTYESIEITLDGVIVATLLGGATAYTVTGMTPGSHTICVRAFSFGAVVGEVCCDVAFPFPPDLLCEQLEDYAVITWEPQPLLEFDEYEVEVDGVTIETVPGDQFEVTVEGLSEGSHTICVTGILGSAAYGPTCCEVDVVATGPTGLTCEVAGAGSDVVLSWVNPGTYLSIDILVDGTMIDTLPGSPTSYVVTDLAPGGHTLCIRAQIGAIILPMVCCEVFLAAGPPEQLTCDLIAASPDVAVTWVNPVSYGSIAIWVDGAVWTSLPGTATFVVVTGLTPGAHQICVAGIIVGDPPVTACCEVTITGVLFLRGDCNDDGGYDIGDAIATLDHVISGVYFPLCDDACDSNDDGQLDIADAIFSLGAVFGTGPLPAAPFPDLGVDPTADGLGCDAP